MRYRQQESDAAVVLEPQEAANAAVIWLHGLGADGYDFVPIAPELSLPQGVNMRFVFPHAPVRPVTLNNGMAMRAWYDIKGLDRHSAEDAEGIQQSADTVSALLDQQLVGLDHVFLGRFDGEPAPDPAEVSEWRWVEPAALLQEATRRPGDFTHWFHIAFEQLRVRGYVQAGEAMPR